MVIAIINLASLGCHTGMPHYGPNIFWNAYMQLVSRKRTLIDSELSATVVRNSGGVSSPCFACDGKDFEDLCSFAYSLGASAITVGELCLSGRASQNRDLLLSNDQREHLYQKVHENALLYRGRMIVKSSNSVLEGLQRQRKAPSSAALIRPNGDIRIDGMAPFVIGNVLKDDFAEVWEKKIYTCWNNPKVKEFISDFDDDRNYSLINFVDQYIYIEKSENLTVKDS